MNRNETNEVGSRLGYDAAEHIARHAEHFSEHERQRIELTNEARINALHIEGAHLTSCARRLEERLRHVEFTGNIRHQRRKQAYYWATAGILSLAAFFFSVIALAPYRLGWVGHLYCLGIALVTPFAVEEFLQAWRDERVFKAVITIVFLSALIGGTLLAAIRGDLLAESVEQPSPAAVIDGEGSAAPPAQENTFYASTHASLRMLMLFLALAIDLGAGVAAHRALVSGAAAGEDGEALARELADVRGRLAGVVFEMTALRNAPAIFVAGFWRDFYRAMLTQATRRAVSKWFGLSLCLLLFASPRLLSQTRTDYVVALDLSTSEAFQGRDTETQLKKSVRGVERLLASVDANSRVTVIGITEHSFADPYIILQAEVSSDPGYFGERLTGARRQILHVWHERASRLTANAHGTDLLGALRLASELFQRDGTDSRRILILYSDMRHVTRDLNLEATRIPPVESIFATVPRGRLLANLHGVTVYVLGANADGRKVAEWEMLKSFWATYFQRAGANLGGYSLLCDPPKLGY